MLQNSILLVDKNFNSDFTGRLDLLLEINEDSFSYAILEHDTLLVKAIYSLQNEEIQSDTVKKIFEEHSYLSSTFYLVKASVRSSEFTFTPDELFKKGNQKNFDSLFSGKKHLHHAWHKELGIHSTFSTALDLEKILPTQSKIFSHLSSSIACIKEPQTDSLLLEFGSNWVSFLFLKDRKLQFQNHFLVTGLEDFNYFLLLVKQQLKISKNDVVLVQGLINKEDSYFTCLESYFVTVKVNVIATQAFGELVEDMPLHYFNSLLSLHLCE